MRAAEQNLDFSSLPYEARKELIDFYEFLKTKYQFRKQTNSLPDEFYHPIQAKKYIEYKREDIYREI